MARREEPSAFAGPKIIFTRFDREPSEVAVVAGAGGRTTRLVAGDGSKSSPRWIDPTRLVLQQLGLDFRTREILVGDVTGRTTVVHRDVDRKLWNIVNADPIPSPDGRSIAFLSDRDGWDHVYVVLSGSSVNISGRREQRRRHISISGVKSTTLSAASLCHDDDDRLWTPSNSSTRRSTSLRVPLAPGISRS
jgi:hypothetical protein